MPNDNIPASVSGEPATPITPEQQIDAKSAKVMRFQHLEMVGPLPPASEFGKYDQILPGAAERILLMAEKEQQHRHTLTERHTAIASEARNDESRHVERGQHYGLVVSMTAIILGSITMIVGIVYGSVAGAITGGVVGTGGLASVILAFLGKRSETTKATEDESA